MYWIIGFSIVFSIILAIVLYAYLYKGKELPLGMFALIVGLIYKTNKLNENASVTFGIVCVALLFSFLGLVPSAKEVSYVFSDRLMKIPIYFVFIYGIFSIAFNYEKLFAKIDEGIVFMQSLAIIYFIWEMKKIAFSHVILISLSVLALIGCCYSIYHAFSLKEHTSKSRLRLSIWSMIVYGFFAVIYLIDFVFMHKDASDILTINSLLIIIQYFLLGISTMYIMHNFVMIISFLPGKTTFFNKEYFKDLKQQRKLHINRFVVDQQNISVSIFSLVYAIILFGGNYIYKIVRPELIIWILFFTFPIVYSGYRFLRARIA
jgi:uncharacterized membrane protein YqjE